MGEGENGEFGKEPCMVVDLPGFPLLFLKRDGGSRVCYFLFPVYSIGSGVDDNAPVEAPCIRYGGLVFSVNHLPDGDTGSEYSVIRRPKGSRCFSSGCRGAC